MKNLSVLHNSPSKSNPFKEYFLEDSEKKNDLSQSSTKLNFDIYQNEVLGDVELRETLLETKINKQLSGKKVIRRRSSKFLSSNEIKQINLEDSLKDIGVFSKPDEDHLIIRKLPNISEEQYYQKQKEIINKEMLSQLYNYLKTINCNFKSPSSGTSVGGISPLTYLVEMLFHANKEKLKEMYEKYDILAKYIHYYRTIAGDGNCFYRAVMFRYLEILILNENIPILQKITFDIIESFNSEELKKRRIIKNEDIKPDLTFKILFLIVYLIKKQKVSEAHQILFKCFLTCQKFDYAIILYFRYILYEYIKKNENKIYLKSFPIKIGNLLPSQFESKNGEFLFNDFYEKYLLHFYTDAEKIIIYLTPFVLGIELNVVVFDLNESTSDILQKFVYEGKSEIKTDDVINLINSKLHYEIIYTKEDKEKKKEFFEKFENNIPPYVMFKEDKVNNRYQNKTATTTTITTVTTEDNEFKLLNSFVKEEVDEKKNKTVLTEKRNKMNDNNNFNNNANKANFNYNNNANNTNIHNINNIQSNTQIQKNKNNNYQNNNIDYQNKSNRINNINKDNNYDYSNQSNYNYNNNLINNQYNDNNYLNKINNINNPHFHKNNGNNNAYINNNNHINFNNNGNNINYNINYNNNNNLNNNANNINNNYINYYNNVNSNNNINNINYNSNNNANMNNNNYNNTKGFNNNPNMNNNDPNSQRNNANYNFHNNIDNNINKLNSHTNINNKNHQKINEPFNNNNHQHAYNNNNNNYQNNNNLINRNNNNLNNDNLNYANNQKNKGEMDPKRVINSPKKPQKKDNEKKNIGFTTPDGNTNKRIGFATPDGNNNDRQKTMTKCKKCQKDIQLINIEKIYCESCSKQHLYNYCLDFIQNNNQDPIITLIDKFNNSKSLNEYLNIYNTNFNHKLDKNVIINNIKGKICIFGESGNKYDKLPCNCNLCSHLNDYFKQFDFNRRFICKCGVCYSRNDMIKLGVFFKKNNQDIFKKISKYFQERTIQICCICGKSLPNKEHFFTRPLSSSSYIILNVNENSLNDFINTYRHYICEQCKKKYTKKEFKCQICEINHL